MWYGIRIDRAQRIVDGFARCGIVCAAPEREGFYRWNAAQDWAVPRSPKGWTIVSERWSAHAVGGSRIVGDADRRA